MQNLFDVFVYANIRALTGISRGKSDNPHWKNDYNDENNDMFY